MRAASPQHRITSGIRCVWFSLTPALSRWERGDHFQSIAKRATVSGSVTNRKAYNAQLLFPLPQGEGQGEREPFLRPVIFKFANTP
jgi:hypothetical protein